MTAVRQPAAGREVFGHPVGLYVLFLTEMWERFCFYGMRALLALYVAHHLARPEIGAHVPGLFAVERTLVRAFGSLDDEQLADQIYGVYTACVFLTPFFGGILADRVLGQYRSVIVGGVIMAVGEFMLMSEALFLPGLLALVIGNGCFKPNITTQVGGLYPAGDPRRDRAFNVFYVGINLGAWFAPLVCGTLGQTVGWRWGFGAAGVGMIVALVVYVAGRKHLAPEPKKARAAKRPGATAERPSPLTRSERRKVVALIALCALNVSFWGVYEQQGNSLQFWADQSTDRHVLRWLGGGWPAWEMPSTWFQSVNPTFILLCTPVVNALWSRQSRRKTEPSSATKMAIGCFFLGISFAVMIGAGHAVDGGRLASMGWLVGCSFLLTLGEIYLSPVGLSLVTKIAPARIVSMMMGLWFLSSFFGNYLSGYLATYAHRMPSTRFFALLGAIALATGAVMLAVLAPVKRAIGDENARDEGA
ncbi:MAG: peptide MFS transporter [Myxococcota bacterium]|nr:peptide MFS transporter [Myxococcota bacterium]